MNDVLASSYLNFFLYPILFENNPVDRAAQISEWIEKGEMGYKKSEKQNYIAAIDYFLKDRAILAHTIAPDYDREKFENYLIEIKKRLAEVE
jgi:hypothetical protein